MTERETTIAIVRRFNRFYTHRIGILQEAWLDSPFSLTETRVLYEISENDALTATRIGADLGLDAGYLSRMLRSFEKQGLIQRRASPDDARTNLLAMTPKGRKAFAPLEAKVNAQVNQSIAGMSKADRRRLVAAMGTIRNLFQAGKAAPEEVRIRAPRHGEFGWIVSRHGELYAEEYGWAETLEGVCAGIVSHFLANLDPKKERCFIAELNGEPVGSAMLVKDGKNGIARIRLVIVDPSARGIGIGTKLTQECIKFARKAGYKGITLWTHSVLVVARDIYRRAGFTLTSSEPQKIWGDNVISEIWDLKL